MDHDVEMAECDQGGRDDIELDGCKIETDSDEELPDSRWILLRALGYEADHIRVAISCCGDQPVEDLADWLEAHQSEDFHAHLSLAEQQMKPLIEHVKELMQLNWKPEHEAEIRRHKCANVLEALDLIEALALKHSEQINLEPSPSSRPTRNYSWETLDLDEYDLGCAGSVPAIAKDRRVGSRTPSTGGRCCVCSVGAVDGKTGFGIPGISLVRRQLSAELAAPPYFYFENVASTPKLQWEEISKTLYGIQPEFVDSKYFSASLRARGYVHNLPIEGRRLVIPQPPMTIQELFPQSCGRYWPAWDDRRKLNCIDTMSASNAPVKRISLQLEENPERILHDEKFRQGIMMAMKKWNLVWTGPQQITPLSAEETEVVLGFDVGHSRGIVNMSERRRALGNSFQINTVAYHLSVLKPMFSNGMNVVSLFAGVGGAEVALHKLGIRMKVLVSVEKDEQVRTVVSNWWKVTGQQGCLINDIVNVKKFTRHQVADLLNRNGKFDLIIGGSPCNNLAGKNRVTRSGLQGKDSRLFYEFKRILDDFRELSSRN